MRKEIQQFFQGDERHPSKPDQEQAGLVNQEGMDFQDNHIEQWHNYGRVLVATDRDQESITKAAIDVIKDAYEHYIYSLAEEIVDELRANGGHMMEGELDRWLEEQSMCRWSFEGPLPELVCLVSDNEPPKSNDNSDQRAESVIRRDLEDLIVKPHQSGLPIKRIRNGVILKGRENLHQ